GQRVTAPRAQTVIRHPEAPAHPTTGIATCAELRGPSQVGFSRLAHFRFRSRVNPRSVDARPRSCRLLPRCNRAVALRGSHPRETAYVATACNGARASG